MRAISPSRAACHFSGNLGITDKRDRHMQPLVLRHVRSQHLPITGYAEVGGAPSLLRLESQLQIRCRCADVRHADLLRLRRPNACGLLPQRVGVRQLRGVSHGRSGCRQHRRGNCRDRRSRTRTWRKSAVAINGSPARNGNAMHGRLQQYVTTTRLDAATVRHGCPFSYHVGTITYRRVARNSALRNAYLANSSSTTFNGQPCALGGACTITASLSGTSLPVRS